MTKAPAIIYLSWVVISLCLVAHLHGKPKNEKYNFWSQLICSAITIALLWWGGFFDALFGGGR